MRKRLGLRISDLTHYRGAPVAAPSQVPANSRTQSGLQFIQDLQTVRSWYKSGPIVGGLYLPDWAYQSQDSVGTAVTAAGQVVGLWKDATWGGELGPELVTNGAFGSDITGWTGTATLSVVSGQIKVASDIASYGTTTISTTVGKTYLLSLAMTTPNIASYAKVGNSAGSNAILELVLLGGSPATNFSRVFVATATTTYISLNPGAYSGGYLLADNISVREVLGNHASQTTTANKPLSARTATTLKNYLSADSTDVLPVTFPSALGSSCTIARATPAGVMYSESQTISTTWNGLISPYQYNSAVLVANRALTAQEKAVVSRVLGRYVPVLGYSYPFAIAQTGGGTVDLKIKTTGATPVFIDWGDGAISVVASNTTETHVYSGAYSGNVRVSSESFITEWTSANGKWNFTGSDLPSTLTSFSCVSGSNTLSGTLSLPSGLTFFDCRGSNTLGGALSLPSGITYFYCSGSNTLSGTLTLPSTLTSFYCYGSNTLSGTLTLPSGVTYFICTGSNTLSGYTSSAKASNQARFYHVPVAPGGLSSAQVDQLLIDYAAAGGTWVVPKEVYIKGTNAARTSASDAAVATLQGKGVTVTTN